MEKKIRAIAIETITRYSCTSFSLAVSKDEWNEQPSIRAGSR